MNSHQVLQIETRQTWLEGVLGPRGARVLLAACGAFGLVLSVPTAMLEKASDASGLAAMLPFLAAPIALPVRVGIGLTAAACVAALVWIVLALVGADRPARAQPATKDQIMKSARKPARESAWTALTRLVRGRNDELEDEEILARRRRDRHPDAPPRPPLFASRDLPPPDDAARVAHAATLSEAAAQLRQVGADDLPEDSLLPRSPEPLSDAEIALLAESMPPRPTFSALTEPEFPAEFDLVPEMVAEPVSMSAPAPADGAVPAAPPAANLSLREQAGALPLISGASLANLASRLEAGLAKCEAVAHATQACASLNERLILAQPDAAVRAALRAQRPVELVSPPPIRAAEHDADEPVIRVDKDVELALNNALATLRKLTEQGRR